MARQGRGQPHDFAIAKKLCEGVSKGLQGPLGLIATLRKQVQPPGVKSIDATVGTKVHVDHHILQFEEASDSMERVSAPGWQSSPAGIVRFNGRISTDG